MASLILFGEAKALADEVDREAVRNHKEVPQEAAALYTMTAEAVARRVAGGMGPWWRPGRPNW